MAKVTRSNPKAFQELDLHLKELERVEGRVGWFESSKYENGTPVAYVAAIQELGSTTGGVVIPPRPTIRPTAISQRANWSALAAQGARAVLAGTENAMSAMEKLTVQAQGDITKAIVQLVSPPLSPVTIELRAMKKRNPGLKITRATVGEAARKVAQPGYQTPNVSTKPLNDSGLLIATLDHTVTKK